MRWISTVSTWSRGRERGREEEREKEKEAGC